MADESVVDERKPSLFLAGPAYLALPRAPETWLVQGILPAGGSLNIYGPPKEGKTFAAIDLAMAISDERRTHFLEWEVKTHGPVWYLQIDTPRGLFHTEYLEPIVNAGHCINNILIADKEMVPYPFEIIAAMDGGGKKYLRDAFKALPAPLAIIVDTLRDAHGHDENDSGVMRNVIASFVDAGRLGGNPAWVFISHSKKQSDDMPVDLMQGNRGSNYVAGRMDCVMRVAKNVIMVQSRSLKLTSLTDYKRNGCGLWAKFMENHEIRRYLDLPFASMNARHEAFAKEWYEGKNISTVRNYFINYQLRGSFDKYPGKADRDPA